MKYIFVLVFLISSVYSSVLTSTVLSVDKEQKTATMNVDKIDIGMSGFVVHKFTDEHASILKNAIVDSYDEQTKIATLKLSEYDDLQHSALPRGKWDVSVGDKVVLAFGYSRALLIAPNEEIYNKITKNAKTVQWIHPDIFATILSMNGHPTPIEEDFKEMSISANTGLFFFYLDKKLYTLDARSFKILNISEISFEQKNIKLPFYSRIDKIDKAWFGEGSEELQDYEPHYFSLMVKHNPKNRTLFETIKNSDKKLHSLLSEFDIEDRK
jgi:hypothetical protein